MGICGSIGLPAYNTTDLQAWGFITRKLVRQYIPGEKPSEQDLKNPRPGVTYKQILFVDENNKPILDDIGRKQLVWIETRLILPAKQLLVEFFFRSSKQSSNISLGTNAGNPSFGALGAGSGTLLIDDILNDTLLGGIASQTNEFTWHLCSARTKINLVLKVDKTVRGNNGVIELPGYVVAILGAFKEPLVLTDGQTARIGESLTTQTSRFGIKGDTNGSGITFIHIIEGGGVYKGKTIPALFPATTPQASHVLFDQNNLLKDVLFDTRQLVYRADNRDMPNNPYGPQNNIQSSNDVSSRRIQIDMQKFGQQDGNIYVTACLANNRIFREDNLHFATLAETADRAGGATTQVLPIKSLIDTWHYQIVKWRVKKKPILENATGKTLNEAYLSTVKVTIDVFSTAQESLPSDQQNWEVIQSWRISEIVSRKITQVYHADSTGIILLTVGSDGLGESSASVTKVTSEVLLSRASIQDQSWFDKYLTDNNLTTTDFGSNGISSSEFFGALFDLSEHVNTLVIDGVKVPYSRIFAKAIKKANSQIGIGISNLDIRNENISQFDLTSAVFKDINTSSHNPAAWGAMTCPGGQGGFGGYYDPIDPFNIFSPIVPVPRPNVLVEWLMSTPFYSGSFNRDTRVFMERFDPQGLSLVPSAILVYSLPNAESSLSMDYTAYHDESFAFFENENVGAITYYAFTSGFYSELVAGLVPFLAGTHTRGDYDHEKFKFIGYNVAIGDIPSYSEGSLISRDSIEICNGRIGDDGQTVTFDKLYKRGTWVVPASLTDKRYEVQGISEEDLYRDILIEYNIVVNLIQKQNSNGLDKIFNDNVEVGDALFSIEFQNTNRVIDNIGLPIGKGKHKILIDGKFYSGSPVILHSDIMPYMKDISIKTVSSTTEKMGTYLIAGRQTACAIDGKNRIHLFYHDESSGNISVAISGDLGATWCRYRDIIRLVGGETAEQPYVICDKDADTVYLFYKLNGRFLMIKQILTDWFECDDQFIAYEPPDTFNEESDDDLALTLYTDGGKALRKKESYFIQGEKDDAFITTEMDIVGLRAISNFSYRFAFAGNLNGSEGLQMDQAFDGGTYAAYWDNENRFRVVFTLGDGKINWKTSGNGTHWYYDVRAINLHKNRFDEDPGIDDLAIDNPQVVYDDLNDAVYFFYFYHGSLFFRLFNNKLLSPSTNTDNVTETEVYDGSQSDDVFVNDPQVKSHIEISEDSTNLPVFVTGILEAQTIETLNSDFQAFLNESEPVRECCIDFYYEDPEKFKEDFGLDTNSKPVGYIAPNGAIRLLYRIDEGLVFGASISGSRPSLDCRFRHSI